VLDVERVVTSGGRHDPQPDAHPVRAGVVAHQRVALDQHPHQGTGVIRAPAWTIGMVA
jgi:hypothetical protein